MSALKQFLIVGGTLLSICASFSANAEKAFKNSVSADETVRIPIFQFSLVSMSDGDGDIIKEWKQYADTEHQDNLYLAAGHSFDMHVRPYSTYGISSQKNVVEPWLKTQEDVLNYAAHSYKWRTAPKLLKNSNGATCVGEMDDGYSFEDGFIYAYQGVCFHPTKHLAIKFLISMVKLEGEAIKMVTQEPLKNLSTPMFGSEQLSRLSSRLFETFKPI